MGSWNHNSDCQNYFYKISVLGSSVDYYSINITSFCVIISLYKLYNWTTPIQNWPEMGLKMALCGLQLNEPNHQIGPKLGYKSPDYTSCGLLLNFICIFFSNFHNIFWHFILMLYRQSTIFLASWWLITISVLQG